MRLCKNCPFRIASPKAGELGGSVPMPDALGTARACMDGLKVMQCHKSPDSRPSACAGFLSVVGYESIGVRLAVMRGIVSADEVGIPMPGLYGSMREMLREADYLELDSAPG